MRDLIEACYDGDLEEVKSILKSGVDVNKKHENIKNVTALIVASCSKNLENLELVKYII